MYMENIQILGLKGTIDSVSETLNLIDGIKEDSEIIQLLNADSIASRNHIIHGVNQAILAFDRCENLAKDLSVEIVLRCSAQRQISKAFEILGLKEGYMNLCAILVNSKNHTSELSEIFSLDDNVFIPDDEILMKIYKISDIEIKNMSLEDIIIDRITKLTVNY
ncbi:KEOPS complex subunit Cgi121 [Methanobrevibacter gottschalkii DSM 11977]|uniref:KEOPS complex subunit Cgi121 n=1 Tax=Methanobrevibacter gottschalkii DSM 11977 TaxID=1122229 RepID=A0A3N5B584_9EURY|nr:KEOPS complex subunit Cgi121 [Methanobrevibacter gottschalkii]RPF50720.1 KEOPS complex subunit Cgi121 [Methanobrevibacter gottschalkii DSM 11977]